MEVLKLLSSFQVELRVIRSLAECLYVRSSYYTPDPMEILMAVDVDIDSARCLPYDAAWHLVSSFVCCRKELDDLWQKISLYASSCDSPDHSEPEDIIPYAFYTASVAAFAVKRYEESRSFSVKALERLLPPNFDFDSFSSLKKPIEVSYHDNADTYMRQDEREEKRIHQLRICVISLLKLQLYSTILTGESAFFLISSVKLPL